MAKTTRSALMVIVSTLLAGRLWAAANECRYTIEAQIVRDNVTGLVWQRTAVQTTFFHADAVNYCRNLSLAGHGSGWRMPTIRELETLVDVRRQYPAADLTAFPSDGGGLDFWSSTPYVPNGGAFWSVSFLQGNLGANGGATIAYRVRCVR